MLLRPVTSNPTPHLPCVRHREHVEEFVPSRVQPFREQNFKQLRSAAKKQARSWGGGEEQNSFQDPYFPNELYDKEFVWRRVRTVNPRAKFFTPRPHGASVRDHFRLVPGAFQAIWFHAALTQVAQRKELLKWLIPGLKEQSKGWLGIFRFRFWHAGQLREVVVDDLLPFEPDGHSPVFVTSAFDTNEYWCALLEKAYAKLHGSYSFLLHGHSEQALSDLTGGFPQTVRLDLATIINPLVLIAEMKAWLRNRALVIASVKYKNKVGEVLDTDLVTGLPYTVLDARKSADGDELVCLQPPDPQHRFIHEESRPPRCCRCLSRMPRYRKQPADKFWMRHDEFLQNFHYLIAVHLVDQHGSYPTVYRHSYMWVTAEVKIYLTHMTGVFVRQCSGWGDWAGLAAQLQFGFSVRMSESKLLLQLVQESLPLLPISSLCLLVVQAENGRKHRVHDFEHNDSLRPLFDVQIEQYGGCYSSVLGAGTYILIPYSRLLADTHRFLPRRFSLRMGVTNTDGVRELNDSVCKKWTTITKLSVADFTFNIPVKREQLHEKEFIE